jgi:outer membrane immunogenic protein
MNFRALALGSVAALALSAGFASAADLPRRSAAVAPAPVVAPVFTWTGFYAGLNAGLINGRDLGASESSFTVGARVGFDYQVGALVVGVLADADYSGLDVNGFQTRFVGQLNARVGFLAQPSLLLYATGGYTYADVDMAGISYANGWNVGAGVEYRINANWSTFVEYRYHDLRTEGTLASRDVDAHTVKIGVNYRFGSAAAPVVARY